MMSPAAPDYCNQLYATASYDVRRTARSHTSGRTTSQGQASQVGVPPGPLVARAIRSTSCSAFFGFALALLPLAPEENRNRCRTRDRMLPCGAHGDEVAVNGGFGDIVHEVRDRRECPQTTGAWPSWRSASGATLNLPLTLPAGVRR